MPKVNILLLSIFSLLLPSCSQRWCSSHYPVQSDTLRIETVRDSIVYKDTTIFVTIPGRTIIDSVLIPCPEVPGYVPKKAHLKTDFAEAWAWWEFPAIKLKLEQTDTILKVRLENAIKEKYYWKSLYEKLHIKPPPEKYIPGFYKGCLWILIGEVLVIVLMILFKKFMR